MSETKLLLKQKDYEQIAAKSKKVFHRSIHDPLINPPKYKSEYKQIKHMHVPHLNANNPLATNHKSVLQLPSASAVVKKQTNNVQEQQKSKDVTPWQQIIEQFQKVFDVQKQPIDIQIANAFGSYGIKIQSQINSRSSVADPNDKSQKNSKITIRTFLKILSGMKTDLNSRWDKGDKVGSLQIAIQSCKLLHDTSNAKFHALKFANCMQIVQKFGIYVFERIKSLSFPNMTPQRIKLVSIKDLEGVNVPQSAQQICRNWLIKISSIRQLIPRTLVQTTLLRLHFFLDGGQKAKKVLYRLAKSNRCFGQPINCIFFCTFLIRMGHEVLPQDKQYILDILDDVFFYIKQGKSKFSREDVSYDQFFAILQPFFKVSFQSLSQSLQKDKFKRFCSILPQNPHPIILANFIQSFSPSLLVYYSIDLAKMLQKLYKQHKYQIYKIILERLRQMVFPQSGQFIFLVWTDIEEINNLQTLLDLLGPFSQIIFRNLPRYQKNRFYSLILDKFNSNFYNFRNVDKAVFNSFEKFLSQILARTQNIEDILTLQPFLQLISYFPNQPRRQISIKVVETLLLREQIKIDDPVIIHITLSLMKNLKGFAKTDVIKSVALKFLDKIDFGNDLEQSLSFFCQMRANFGYIKEVTVPLIYRAAGLTIKARKLSKGKITNKLVSFLQAVLAFCYITVPVLEQPHLRLKIYLYLSQVALSNNLIEQANSLIKTCITQLAQVDTLTDFQIYETFSRIISFLIVMPDDPENQFLFLFNGLFQAFSISRLKSNFEAILKFKFYTECILYLACQAQQKLPFHIQGVVSNDGLFKSKQFRKALIQKIQEVFSKLQSTIEQIARIETTQVQLYTIKALILCLLSLISTFQETPRLTNFIEKCSKILDRISNKIGPQKDKIQKYVFSNALKGLNSVMQDNQIKIRVKTII